MAIQKKLGEILIEQGATSLEVVEQALAHQQTDPQRLGRILVAMQAINEEQLARALAAQSRLPLAKMKLAIPPSIAALLPPELAMAHRAMAFGVRAIDGVETVYVALTDPFDPAAMDAIREGIGRPVKYAVAPADELERVLVALYPAPVEAAPEPASEVFDAAQAPSAEPAPAAAWEGAAEQPPAPNVWESPAEPAPAAWESPAAPAAAAPWESPAEPTPAPAEWAAPASPAPADAAWETAAEPAPAGDERGGEADAAPEPLSAAEPPPSDDPWESAAEPPAAPDPSPLSPEQLAPIAAEAPLELAVETPPEAGGLQAPMAASETGGPPSAPPPLSDLFPADAGEAPVSPSAQAENTGWLAATAGPQESSEPSAFDFSSPAEVSSPVPATTEPAEGLELPPEEPLQLETGAESAMAMTGAAEAPADDAGSLAVVELDEAEEDAAPALEPEPPKPTRALRSDFLGATFGDAAPPAAPTAEDLPPPSSEASLFDHSEAEPQPDALGAQPLVFGEPAADLSAAEPLPPEPSPEGAAAFAAPGSWVDAEAEAPAISEHTDILGAVIPPPGGEQSQPLAIELGSDDVVELSPADVEEEAPESAEPVALEPAATEPLAPETAASDPVELEPVAAEPAESQPLAAEPEAPEPAESQPLAAEPEASEPPETEPVASGTIEAETAASEAAPASEPAEPEPAETDVGEPEPVEPEPVAEEGVAESSEPVAAEPAEELAAEPAGAALEHGDSGSDEPPETDHEAPRDVPAARSKAAAAAAALDAFADELAAEFDDDGATSEIAQMAQSAALPVESAPVASAHAPNEASADLLSLLDRLAAGLPLPEGVAPIPAQKLASGVARLFLERALVTTDDLIALLGQGTERLCASAVKKLVDRNYATGDDVVALVGLPPDRLNAALLRLLVERQIARSEDLVRVLR